MDQSTYELKYCERCGSLLLRRSHTPETYCKQCIRTLTSYSLPGSKIRKPLPVTPELLSLAMKSQAEAPGLLGRAQ